MAPTTRSLTLPERSIGTLNKLPLELRTEIYRYLLSTAYTVLSHEQELAAGRTKRIPTRSFNLHPNILRVSKWVNEEADRVFHNENLWVQVAFSGALGNPTGLHNHLNRRTSMGHISFPQSQAVRAPARIALGIKMIDSRVGTNLHEAFDNILLPASQLKHFVALLHSLMCSTHLNDPDNFGLRSSIEISVGKLCHLTKNQSYDLLKHFEGLRGFKKAKIQVQGKRDLQIRTIETELRDPIISTYGWGVEMYLLHEESMMMQKREVPYTLVRDYNLDLVEMMRAPCEQLDIMKTLSPGALQEVHRLRWISRLNLVRHEFHLAIDDKALCTMGWMQLCNEMRQLRYMYENNVPMYHAEARPTYAEYGEWLQALDDADENVDHTLYDENDKRAIWGLYSMVADINDDLRELCRDTWHLAYGPEADEDDREGYQRALARYRKRYKRDYDITVHGQTG